MENASSTRRWWTLAAVVFAVFVTTLDNTVVNVALPSIQHDLHLGLSGLAWVVNSYILSFAVLLLTGGRLADTFGRRRVFLLGLAGFTAASLLAGLAPSAGLLIVARALQGVGDHQRRVPRRARARHGGLHLGSGVGRRVRRGPAGRRADHRADRLELDLLRERADRARGPRAGLAADSGVA